MYPILFDSKATSFTTNGIGRLSDAKSCKVTEERNGSYELEMDYPRTGIHFESLKNENIILAKPFQNGSLQAFRIYKIARKATDLASIYARHISYQLSYIPVSPFSATTASSALAGLKTNAPENCPFTFSTDVTRSGSFTFKTPDSARSLMGGKEGSILETFHGEYEWNNYNVILHEARGSNKGVTIVYGKNLIDLTQEENIENTVTGIYPYWYREGNTESAMIGMDKISGYYYNSEFYEDEAHTKKVTPQPDKNYYDIPSQKIYIYDEEKKKYEVDEIGQYGKGNIDLYNRPVYESSDATQVVGYYYDNAFYEDSDHKKQISPNKTYTYFDPTTDKYYYYDGGKYVESPIGKYSTIAPIIIEEKKSGETTYILIPTIGTDTNGNPVKWSEAEAKTYYTNTEKYLGKFSTKTAAESYSEKLQAQQNRIYKKIGETTTYVELPEKVLYSDNAANYPYKRSIVKDFTSVFDTTPTENQMRDYTKKYISENKIGIPTVSLDVKFINLYETPGYKDVAALQSVNLCDTVTVIFSKLGVTTQSKVVKTTFDVLRERYEEVSIGDTTASLSSTISDQLEQITYRPTLGDVRKALDRATGVLNSGMRGHVILNRNESGWANELLFLDNENIVSAKNVLRINMNGIGFSSTGYKGPYFQSWTNDGHLTLGGINNSYGDFQILDENATPMIDIDKSGFKLYSNEGTVTGYLVNNVFYLDQVLQQPVSPHKGTLYYDYSTSKPYVWNGTAYVQSTDTTGLSAKMTHDGLGLYKGEIDLKWNGERGIYLGKKGTDDELYIGDFKVYRPSSDYDRPVFESDDEMTGMSGYSRKTGFLYMWAGWHNENNYKFVVNEDGARTMYGDNKYIIGQEIYRLWEKVNELEKEIDDLGPTSSGGSSGGEIGGYEDIAPGSQH